MVNHQSKIYKVQVNYIVKEKKEAILDDIDQIQLIIMMYFTQKAS